MLSFNKPFTQDRALFLHSDFGWSVFFDTYGDKDPTDVRPELVHIKEGIPTNKRTGERKMRVRDGDASQIRTREHPDESPVIRGRQYVLDTAAQASWSVYWITGAQAFEHSMGTRVHPKAEWSRRGPEPFHTFSFCRCMQRILWLTFSTTFCGHPPNEPQTPTKLGPEAAAVMGWKMDQDDLQNIPERVIIYLTKGEPRIRWLAARAAVVLGRDAAETSDPVTGEIVPGEIVPDPQGRPREVMLRTEDCCDECALEQTIAMPGYWILIL